MPKVLLTDIVASTAKPVLGKQVSLWDTRTKNFGLRINPQGTKTWQVMIGDKRQRITIGHYPEMSLKDARKLALKTIGNGEAPPKQSTDTHALPRIGRRLEVHRAQSRELETAAMRKKRSGFSSATSSQDTPIFLSTSSRPPTSSPSSTISPNCLPSSSTRTEPSRPSSSGRCIGNSSRLARCQPPNAWQDQRTRSPAHRCRARARSTTPQPISPILSATSSSSASTRACAAAKSARSSGATSRRSSSRSRKRSRRTAASTCSPISSTTTSGSCRRLPSISSPLRPVSPSAHGEKTRRRLDKLCGVDDFVLHDFRRYLSSTMRRLGVPIDVTETILNHVSGSRSQIQRIYDRHDRLPEMREALQLYEKHLAALIAAR